MAQHLGWIHVVSVAFAIEADGSDGSRASSRLLYLGGSVNLLNERVVVIVVERNVVVAILRRYVSNGYALCMGYLWH